MPFGVAKAFKPAFFSLRYGTAVLQINDGATQSFVTEEGKRLTVENLPKVSIKELRNGTARLRLTRGVDVDGVVVNDQGEPIQGATVLESISGGNLRALSTNVTDSLGKFRLPNRQPREILLGISADGFQSMTALETVAKEKKSLRLVLPRETPLIGRVTDTEGRPIAGAQIGLIDYLNDGLGLRWSDTTLPDGRFIWSGAPSNQLVVAVNADGFATKYARIQAGKDEPQITLKPGILNSIHLSGRVIDEDAGRPVDHFEVNVHSIEDRSGTRTYIRKSVKGENGRFAVHLKLDELEIRRDTELAVGIEASGYESWFGGRFRAAEGDQEFEIKLHTGGEIAGTILTPDGQPAAKANVAVAVESYQAFFQNGDRLHSKATTTSDSEGHFKIKMPLFTTGCAFAHESGWAREPLPDGNSRMDITLRPWSSVQVIVDPTVKGGSGSEISLNSIYEENDPLNVMQSKDANAGSTVQFLKVPAGNYTVAFVPMTLTGTSYTGTLQTNFTLSEGEHRIIVLKAEGVPASARLKFPSAKTPAPADVLTILKLDVAAPTSLGTEYYASNNSFDNARKNYERNPEVAAARLRERAYFGKMGENGVIDFGLIPPGRYSLESKQFESPAKPGAEAKVIAETHAAIEVVENLDQTIDLGTFELEPK